MIIKDLNGLGMNISFNNLHLHAAPHVAKYKLNNESYGF